VASVSVAYAGAPKFTRSGMEIAEPPSGWSEFCSANKTFCEGVFPNPRTIALSDETLKTLASVNKLVNAKVPTEPTPALMTFNKNGERINHWVIYPETGADCKSFVLQKRKLLLEAGFPPEALLVTVVWSVEGFGHAVLMVRTDRGEYVLDIFPWDKELMAKSESPHQFVKMQDPTDLSRWIYIDDQTQKPQEKTAQR
jgi:predicted transglutaminase-like cysteine proteinase